MKKILSLCLSLFLLNTTCFSIYDKKKFYDDIFYGGLGISTILVFSKIEKELMNEFFSNSKFNLIDNTLSALIGLALLNMIGSGTESVLPTTTPENKKSSKEITKTAATTASILFIIHLAFRLTEKPN